VSEEKPKTPKPLFPKSYFLSPNKGFALLIAVIAATVILTVGASIVNNAIKEVILASTVRNSLVSLYRADTGTECFLYWHNVRGRFDIESAFVPGSSFRHIECAGITDIEITQVGANSAFWIRDKVGATTPCTYIARKPPNDDPTTLVTRSWGFNSCDPTNTRRVDRAFEIRI